ncbi:MAG: hypothetical protein L0K62_00105 [Lactobacillus sp.]|nr:hypothetical protein [Lactobacillus sp.]MDN6663161.1 hypothetical protein [Tetragenococcus koreensis]
MKTPEQQKAWDEFIAITAEDESWQYDPAKCKKVTQLRVIFNDEARNIDELKETVVELYKSGKTYREIVYQTGTTPNKIRSILDNGKVKRRTKGGADPCYIILPNGETRAFKSRIACGEFTGISASSVSKNIQSKRSPEKGKNKGILFCGGKPKAEDK